MRFEDSEGSKCYYEVEHSSSLIFQGLSSSLSEIIDCHEELLREVEENRTARNETGLMGHRSAMGALAVFSPSTVSIRYPGDISSLCAELNRRSVYGLIGDICCQIAGHVSD
jgi:hypothetical protein